MPTITVTWNAYSTFDVPETVKLMSPEDNAAAKEGDVGSWFIKHNTLFYIDSLGYEECIGGSDIDIDSKRPCESSPPEFSEPVKKADTECFYCRDEAFGTYGEHNLPMCRDHKHSTGNSDTDTEEEKEQ